MSDESAMLKECPQKKRKILLVEDDPILLESYASSLEDNEFEVLPASTFDDAKAVFLKNKFDAVVLDLRLGSESDAGFILCSEFRKHDQFMPIIFMSAYFDDVNRLVSLKIAADDFISKQTSMNYVAARINALIRKNATLIEGQNSNYTAISGSSLKINKDLIGVRWKDRPVELTLTQFWIVKSLFEARGNAVSSLDLAKAAKMANTMTNVAVTIMNIRKAFQKIDSEFAAIKTERTKGYRWNEV